LSKVLRVLSGVGGVVVLLTSALFTLGTSLAAPIGILVAHRRARRKDRALTAGVAWFTAAIASIIAAAIVFLALFALMPGNPFQEIQRGMTEAQTARDTAATPAWLRKAFPQSARSDSAAKEIMKSPGFLVVTVALSLLFACVFLGALGGSAGWVGSVLLCYAIWGGPPWSLYRTTSDPFL